MTMFTLILFSGAALLGLTLLGLLISMMFRRVVDTNETHIVQYRKKTVSYGKGTEGGNVYYEWPASIPFFGVIKTVLPVSIFDLDLAGYEAYDRGRLPFMVDIKAFFRITDYNTAAQRVSGFTELTEQLRAVVQGAVRTILASSEIEEIMQGRSKFGSEFTKEVDAQLDDWGVKTVKNIELMDIRDSGNSHVIQNIMAKKKSHIEMESRREVAGNKKQAETAEIEALREIELRKQDKEQAVGLRQAEVAKEVGLANEVAKQAVKEQMKVTAEKNMAVKQVELVRESEITRDVGIVKADQEKQTQVLLADGKLAATKRDAEGIEIQGAAKAAAQKAMELAPVQAQIALAKEIGENKGYQEYLVSIRRIDSEQAVGIQQAQALQKAEIKVITNVGSPTTGLKSVMDAFSSRGGTEIGAMLEGFKNTELGGKIVDKVLSGNGSNGSGKKELR